MHMLICKFAVTESTSGDICWAPQAELSGGTHRDCVEAEGFDSLHSVFPICGMNSVVMQAAQAKPISDQRMTDNPGNVAPLPASGILLFTFLKVS